MAVSERRRKGCGPVHEQLSGPVVRMRHAVRSASIRQKRSQGMQSRTCDTCDDATARHSKTRQRARGTARDPTLRRLFRRAEPPLRTGGWGKHILGLTLVCKVEGRCRDFRSTGPLRSASQPLIHLHEVGCDKPFCPRRSGGIGHRDSGVGAGYTVGGAPTPQAAGALAQARTCMPCRKTSKVSQVSTRPGFPGPIQATEGRS